MNKLILTWKYFFEQKYEEIREQWIALLIISIIISYSLALIAFLPEDTIWWLGIIAISIVGFWLLLGAILLIKLTCRWLHSNWKKASKRADEEIKRRKKQ
jgi:Na+/proline symporter